MFKLKRLAKVLVKLFFSPEKLSQKDIHDFWNNANVCCVLAASGIGDSIMATPFLKAIKKCRPSLKVILVSSDRTYEVFKNNPYIDELISYKYRIFPLIKLLFLVYRRKIDFFFGVQPSNTIYHALIAGFSEAAVRLKHTKDYLKYPVGDFSFVFNVIVPSSTDRHRVELNLDFLRFLGEDIPENSFFPQFFVSKKAGKKVDFLFQKNGINNSRDFITIHPGSGRNEKIWSGENFAIVANYLNKEKFMVFFVGGKNEYTLCENIVKKIDGGTVFNFAGMLTLEETAAVLKKSNFLISNDSGIMHLASAVNIPVIALFGPTNSNHIGPYSKKAVVLKADNDIKRIKVENVIDSIRILL